MADHRIEYKDPDPYRPLPSGAAPADAPDGPSHDLFAPTKGVKVDNSIFNAKTDVFYANGIATGYDQSSREAQTFANLTHKDVRLIHDHTDGKIVDVVTAIKEASLPEFAEASAPGKILAAEILESIDKGHDVHIGAYSRGAIVTEDAIKLVDAYLAKTKHMSPADIEKYNHHITLETFNGFSHTVAKGVEAVHYVNKGDYAVGNLTGMGNNAQAIRNLVVDPAVIGLENIGTPNALMKWGAYIKTEGIFNQPNGPVIAVDPSLPGIHPIADHDVAQIFDSKQYKPYNVARAEYHEFLLEKNIDHRGFTPDVNAHAVPTVPTGPSISAPSPQGQPESPSQVDAEIRRNTTGIGPVHPASPQVAPGDAPRTGLDIFANGKESLVHAGFHESGQIRDMHNGHISLMTRDSHNQLHVTMMPKAGLMQAMSPDEQKSLTAALAENANVTISLNAGPNGELTAHLHTQPKLEQSLPTQGPAQVRSRSGRGISD